ncbi:type I-E CRISPR-associated protein Cas5/CasD [Schaalia sp. lx-260]|uniref:type I-E CRISPR-associated protein Cas5/CasD n=1 Tax=Schaalia sp. lx-260 TaxID=2899082 RepID=UPI002F2B271C
MSETQSSLLLLFRGPMQSWGDESRFATRTSHAYPTKSGVVGLLAAALGRRREDSIDDLSLLHFGVRVDQPGSLMKDFQTATPAGAKDPLPLISRYYIANAVFLVAIGGERALLETLEKALKSPRFPLYLGRRACPANVDLVIGIVDQDIDTALREHAEWYANTRHKRLLSRIVDLPIFRDPLADENTAPRHRRRDLAVSFNPEHRKYLWREIVTAKPVRMENPDGNDVLDFFSTVVTS